MEAVLAIVLIGALFVLPLGLRAWSDRKRARADQIGAEIRFAVNRQLHGESLLSVQVTPAGLLNAGRVVLDAPKGCERLIVRALSAVVSRVPEDYELVIKPGRARGTMPASDSRELHRAA